MKLLVHRGGQPPLEIESDGVRITCGRDDYEVREQTAHSKDGPCLLVRLEQHDGTPALDLAVFPNGDNSVRLKGGLR